jgi:RecA-family ATPase
MYEQELNAVVVKDKNTYTLADLRDLEVNYETLVEPFIPQVGISTVVGTPDSGKSMLCRNLALAIVFGQKEFLGMPLHVRYGKALFVTTEDSVESTKLCFTTQADDLPFASGVREPGRSLLRVDIEKNLHILLADDLNPEEIHQRVNQYLTKEKYDIVFIDAYGDVFRGGEGNSNIQNRNSLRPYSVIAKQHQVAILFIHHTNKAAKFNAPDQIHVQGGSGFVQKIRTVLELRKSRNNPDLRYLACTKGNAVSEEQKKEAIELRFDNNTFLYTATGKKIHVGNLKEANPNTSKAKIDPTLAEIYRGDETELPRAELVKRMAQAYEITEAMAINWIQQNLKPARWGVYVRPDRVV